MYCLKCGRELESESVFCEDCLQDMENYPVDPSTPVYLPMRKETPAVRKTPVRRRITPEEQIARLKKRVLTLSYILAAVVILLLAAIRPAVNYYLKNYHLRPGQNYTTITPASADPTETSAVTDPTETTADPWEGFAE